jgi:hypothetical protein
VIINSLISMRATQWRVSGKSPLDFMAHELRAEGLAVTVDEDYISVAVNLPYMSIHVIPDGPNMFELHIEESVGGPFARDHADQHIGPVPEALVKGAVIGIKGQLESFSVSLSAITKDPRKAAEIAMRVSGGTREKGKKVQAWQLIQAAGTEGIPAEELCKRLNVTLVKMRAIVGRLGQRYIIEQKNGKLMVRFVGRDEQQ